MNVEGKPAVVRSSSGAHEPRIEAALGRVLRGAAWGGDRAKEVAGALLGRGIAASRTPGMHESEGARLGFSYSYRLIDFDRLGLADGDLRAVVALARELGLDGLNVTHPFKEAVVRCLDGVSPDAAAIGAVNTVVFSEQGAIGHNTDSYGFVESFRRGLPGVRLERVILFGAGGGGMAVGHALLTLGVVSLAVVDRIPEKARSLAAKLARQFPGRILDATNDAAEIVPTADGVVNATPSGMDKYPGSPFDESLLVPGLWVADIVYFPEETALIRAARAAGCQTLGGAGMAIFQAIEAFHLITGHRADPVEMARHFETAPLAKAASKEDAPPAAR